MNKFIVQTEGTTTEFIDRLSAEKYALENDVSIDQIGQIEYVTASLDNDSIFYQTIDAGYPVPNTTCSLALYDDDRATFSTMLILVNESLELGQMTTDTQVSIKCLNDQILYMSALEFKILITKYGFYYKALWDKKNSA
jgi:hypothetical protein